MAAYGVPRTNVPAVSTRPPARRWRARAGCRCFSTSTCQRLHRSTENLLIIPEHPGVGTGSVSAVTVTGVGATGWSQYLAGFHAQRAGITEQVLGRARGADGTPYDWLAS